MRRNWARLAVGLVLVAAGILFLLQNLNLVVSAWGILWALIFAAGGIAFLWLFLRNRAVWWPVIPGLTLLAIAVLIALDSLELGLAERWGGSIVLAGIGIAFALIYISHQQHWWAVVPAGALLSLALMVALFPGDVPEAGAVFLMGLGITFGIVYLLPGRGRRHTWALVPALVLFLLGLFVLGTSIPASLFLWPMVLILAGLYIVYRVLRRRTV